MSEEDSARVHCAVGDVVVTVEAANVEDAAAAFERVWTARIDEARDPELRPVYQQEQTQDTGWSVGD